jgi:hypothetical protein
MTPIEARFLAFSLGGQQVAGKPHKPHLIFTFHANARTVI